MKPLALHVGLMITYNRNQRTIILSQSDNIEKLIDWHGMFKAQTANTEMRETVLWLYKKLVSSIKKTKYIAKVGYIFYIVIKSQIDIRFATSIVTSFAKNLRPDHFCAVDQIFRYLASSQNRGITFARKTEVCLVRYSNSDWAGDDVEKNSTLGLVFILNRELFITFEKKKQLEHFLQLKLSI